MAFRLIGFALAAVLALGSPASAGDAAGLKRLEKAVKAAGKRLAPQLRGKVCVIDFSDLGAPNYTSEFGQKVADLLSDSLVNRRTAAFSVVERRELIKILRDSISLKGDDAAVMAGLQKDAGMDVLVSGTYSAVGPEISLTVKAVEAANGRVIASFSARVPKTDGLGLMIARRFSETGEKPTSEVPAEGAAGAAGAASGAAGDPIELETGAFFEGGDGKLYPLRDGMVLNSKDNYALYARPKAPCWLYIYQVDSSRKAFKLFPNPELKTDVNPLAASKELWIPNGRDFFYLDSNPGREEIYVFATRRPSAALESLKEARLSEIQTVIKTMGMAGTRPSETLAKSKGTEGDPIELITRKLAAQGDFYYRIAFIHQ